jgi:hypothetical protein
VAGGRHSAHLSGCGDIPGAAFDVISDGGEADLQTRLCEPSPAHAAKAVASLHVPKIFSMRPRLGESAGYKPQDAPTFPPRLDPTWRLDPPCWP